ncbi:hypothetical protein [Salegentibacter mishustinae]|uniref:hypothetical protein n=1 Tax=Salegentibacter mishustinae TaxID=270918 RepID=UPI002492E3B1|nr:hypothetical protein [Salegentibacter mishustinae]
MKNLESINLRELDIQNQININGGDTGGDIAEGIGTVFGYVVGGTLIIAAKTVEMVVDMM